MSLFSSLSTSGVPTMALLNHKMLQPSPLTLPCVWHRSGCDTLTPIVTLTVCCRVPAINARCRQPQSPHAHWTHTKGGREKMTFEIRRKWSDTKRSLMKSIVEFKRDWKRLHYFISKIFFVLGLWCNWKELHLMLENRIPFYFSMNILLLEIMLRQN